MTLKMKFIQDPRLEFFEEKIESFYTTMIFANYLR